MFIRRYILYFLLAFMVTGATANSQSPISTKTQVMPGEKTDDLRVGPNPATDFFRVYGYISFSKIQMYNIIGKEMKSFTVTVDNEYNVDSYPAGIYLLRFIDDKNQLLKTIKLYKR